MPTKLCQCVWPWSRCSGSVQHLSPCMAWLELSKPVNCKMYSCIHVLSTYGGGSVCKIQCVYTVLDSERRAVEIERRADCVQEPTWRLRTTEGHHQAWTHTVSFTCSFFVYARVSSALSEVASFVIHCSWQLFIFLDFILYAFSCEWKFFCTLASVFVICW